MRASIFAKLTVLALGVIVGCSDAEDPVEDAGVDVLMDVAEDVLPDVAEDVAPDVVEDVTLDVPPDVEDDTEPPPPPCECEPMECEVSACDDANECAYSDAPDGTACGGEMFVGVCFGGECREAGCGDGVVSEGEGCDDGNTLSRDGCAADCIPEALTHHHDRMMWSGGGYMAVDDDGHMLIIYRDSTTRETVFAIDGADTLRLPGAERDMNFALGLESGFMVSDSRSHYLIQADGTTSSARSESLVWPRRFRDGLMAVDRAASSVLFFDAEGTRVRSVRYAMEMFIGVRRPPKVATAYDGSSLVVGLTDLIGEELEIDPERALVLHRFRDVDGTFEFDSTIAVEDIDPVLGDATMAEVVALGGGRFQVFVQVRTAIHVAELTETGLSGFSLVGTNDDSSIPPFVMPFGPKDDGTYRGSTVVFFREVPGGLEAPAPVFVGDEVLTLNPVWDTALSRYTSIDDSFGGLVTGEALVIHSIGDGYDEFGVNRDRVRCLEVPMSAWE